MADARYALAAFALMLSAPAHAAPSMAGHYHLEGVMETGSELALDPRGTFQWYLVYGALDLFAQGAWRQEDGAVVLESRKAKDIPDPPFDTLRLTIRERDLVPPDGHGAYVRGAD
jgi:hypothetical protein